MKLNDKTIERAQNIKLLISDVDGVLTDGGMYYSSKGDIMKKFHVRDGMGVNMLKRNNIPTIIVTKEKNPIIRQWAKKMNIAQTFDGIIEKVKLNDIGYDFPTDNTLKPSASLPQIINVDSYAKISNINITSIGRGYSYAPDLIAFDGKTGEQISDLNIGYSLGDSNVTIFR